MRCVKEERAALVVEREDQFIEIDIGEQLKKEGVIEDEEGVKIKVDLVLDFYDEWEDDSLFLIQRNSKYLFQDNFKNCKGSLSRETCLAQLRDVCRKNTPDSLGHTLTFNFLYKAKDGLQLRLSIMRDKAGTKPTEAQKQAQEFNFAMGLYALFVYRK